MLSTSLSVRRPSWSPKIKLTCQASVPGADPKKFQEIATATKTGCPVSGALSAVPIELEAKLGS